MLSAYLEGVFRKCTKLRPCPEDVLAADSAPSDRNATPSTSLSCFTRPNTSPYDCILHLTVRSHDGLANILRLGLNAITLTGPLYPLSISNTRPVVNDHTSISNVSKHSRSDKVSRFIRRNTHPDCVLIGATMARKLRYLLVSTLPPIHPATL